MSDGPSHRPGCVIVTRPEGQADVASIASADAHWRIVHAPAMRIAALAPMAASTRVLATLASFDLVHFASANAIEALFAHADALPTPPFAPDALVAVMGPASRRVFARYSAHPHVITPGAERGDLTALDSETLLTTLAHVHPTAFTRALLVKGEGGRDVLAQALGAQGTEVVELPLYRRDDPAWSAPTLVALREALTAPWCCIVFTSSEGVERFARAIDAAGIGTLRTVAVALTLHPRIAQAARAAGWSRVVPVGADDALVATIKSCARS